MITVAGWNDECNAHRIILINEIYSVMNSVFNVEYISQYSLTVQNTAFSVPFCSYDRSKIHIASEGAYWCQFTYQLAHELCHCSTSRKQLPQNIKWFDELICCLSSWIVLNKFATNPSASIVLLYVREDFTKSAFANYVNDIVSKVDLTENTVEKFNKNYSEYKNNENLIKQHHIYYIKFYNALNGYFSGLSFVGKMHLVETNENMEFEEFIIKLKDLCDEKENSTLDSLLKILGL